MTTHEVKSLHQHQKCRHLQNLFVTINYILIIISNFHLVYKFHLFKKLCNKSHMKSINKYKISNILISIHFYGNTADLLKEKHVERIIIWYNHEDLIG